MKKNNIKTLTYSAMLAAIGTALSFFRIPLTNITEITLTGLPIAVGGYFFGPAAGALIGGLIDLLGLFIRPAGPFFPGFTISAALVGAIYGLFLWKKRWGTEGEKSILYKGKPGLLIRIAAAHLTKTLLISLLLNCMWLSIFYGMPFAAVFTGTLAKELINFPFEVALIFFLLRSLSRLKTGGST